MSSDEFDPIDLERFRAVAPPDPPEVNLGKALYLCDSMFCGDEKEALEELDGLRIEFRCYFGVLPKIELAIKFTEVVNPSSRLAIVFFDWGGLSSLGSMDGLRSHCRTFLFEAVEHPSTLYIMASRFTERAMEDAKDEWKGEMPANVFLNMKEAIPYLRCLLQEKGIPFDEDVEETKGVGL